MDMTDLEQRIQRLEDIEEIRSLQSRYQRCVDFHEWDALREIFTPDAESCYDSGKMTYKGADAIIAFLSKSLTKRIKSSHLIHGGEIEIKDSTHATGIWYLEDFLLHRTFLVKLHGTAVYSVEYTKTEQGWRISRIGYKRGYHYLGLRGLLNCLTLR